VKSVTAPDDAHRVMTAFRLGWYLAEVRGRNRPGGPPGSSAQMPDHIDHALPLHNERGATELRIEAQFVMAALAKELHVDHGDHCANFGEAIDNQAKLLSHIRAPKAARALQQGIDVLAKTPSRQARPVAREIFTLLQQALADQQQVVDQRWQAVADAEQALANAKTEAKAAAEAAVKLEKATAEGEQKGLLMLENGATALRHAFGQQADSVTAAQAGLAALQSNLQTLTDAAHQAWEDLAELLWEFDAHIQDVLAAAAESQTVGYQLGRGLAETYWALDPAQVDGSTGWSFLLGEERCAELGRLVGRLGAYMGSYTAPAVAGTIVIWQSVAKTPGWRGEDQDALDAAQQALYRQTRRWYELIVLAQDPTTLIKPYQLMTNYRTVLRAIGLFLPQLVATIAGLGFLGVLLFLLSNNSKVAWAQTLTGVLAAVGLSYAGLTGTVKSSAQAMLTRLRQDGYTDLVVLAVQTAPPVKKEKKLLEQALNQRRLTPATPN
jgi:hypothetical protein